MNKCLIWGTGRTYNLLMAIGYWKDKNCIKGIISSDGENAAAMFDGKKLYQPKDILDEDFDCILVASNKWKEITDEARKLGIPREKLIVPYASDFDRNSKRIVDRLWDFLWCPHIVYLELTLFNTCGLAMPMTIDMWDEPLYMNEDIVERNFYSDYIRVRTLELLRNQIKGRQLKGSMAEVGVFRGRFSKILHTLFPEKKMYLYDTFEGFPGEIAARELRAGNLTDKWLGTFADTNFNLVKEYISGGEKVFFRKGYFPDTIEEDEKNEKFCLVSLDADLFQPTYEGLKFFYPRLEQGGYIIIHDYNHKNWSETSTAPITTPGIKEAVDFYEKTYGLLCKVPVCDMSGSLIITK